MSDENSIAEDTFLSSREGGAGAIDLRSDTVTRPTAGMYRRMLEAPIGDDGLDGDPTAEELEGVQRRWLRYPVNPRCRTLSYGQPRLETPRSTQPSCPVRTMQLAAREIPSGRR